MTEKDYRPQEDIVTLMTQFEQEVKDAPELPNEATRLLRARLVFEEALEFVRACGCAVGRGGSDGAKTVVTDEISVVVDPDADAGFHGICRRVHRSIGGDVRRAECCGREGAQRVG